MASADVPQAMLLSQDAALQTAIAQALAESCRVEAATEARGALQRVSELQPRLLLCDDDTPGLDTEAWLSELHAQPGMSGLPVVVLVDAGDPARRLRLLRAGVHDCLAKPFTAPELQARVAGLLLARRRTQTELQRYEHIVATSGDMLVFIDRQHRYVVANAAYARMYGRTPADLRGRPVADVLGAYNYAGIRANIDRALAGESLHMVVEPALSPGKRRVLGIDYRPFRRDGEVQGVVVSLRDITELKLSEEALKASETRLQLALDASSAGLWDLDLRRGHAHLAPQFLALTGYQPQGETSDFKFLERTVHPDDLQRLLDNVHAHLRGKTLVSECDYRVLMPSGDIKWVRGKGRVVEWDSDGKPMRMIGTITDVGARMANEEALRGQAEELARRNTELERFTRATVGRELDMIELKKQVNALSRELGKDAPFPLAFLQEDEHQRSVAPP